MVKLKNFNNGLRLVYNKLDCFSVSIGIFVKTGCVNETDKENGISHFIEHTLFKGTETRSAFSIADEIEGIGAQVNAYTSKLCTAYYTVSLREHVEKCADILSDIFFNSVFPEDELKKEKGVVIEEINMYEDAPEDACLEQLSTAYYGDHDLGKTILGSKENVSSFTKEMIGDYMKRRYTSDNVVISIAGNIGYDEAVVLVEKYFFDRFSGNKKVGNEDFSRRISTPTYLYKQKSIEQSNLAFAFPCPEMDSNLESAVLLLNGAVGGGMSSRLFQKIREELGLAYSVYSYPSQYTFDGYFCIYLGTNPSMTEKAVVAIGEEIRKLKTGGLTDREISRSRAQLKSAYLMSQESSRAIMNINGKNLLLTGKLLDIDAKIANIEGISSRLVAEAIDYVFDFDRVCASYVGPEDKIPALELLTRG